MVYTLKFQQGPMIKIIVMLMRQPICEMVDMKEAIGVMELCLRQL
jgi:hypothetical protein